MTHIGKWSRRDYAESRTVAQFNADDLNAAIAASTNVTVLPPQVKPTVKFTAALQPSAAPIDAVEVLFDASINEDLAIVHFIKTPEGYRRRGLAKARYFEWEASLPDNVTIIEVDAVANNISLLFWRSLGFTQRDPDSIEDLAEFDLVKLKKETGWPRQRIR